MFSSASRIARIHLWLQSGVKDQGGKSRSQRGIHGVRPLIFQVWQQAMSRCYFLTQPARLTPVWSSVVVHPSMRHLL